MIDSALLEIGFRPLLDAAPDATLSEPVLNQL